MEIKAYTHMVVADCLQRHAQRVESARQCVSTLTSDLDIAKTALDRAIADQHAFQKFVAENRP